MFAFWQEERVHECISLCVYPERYGPGALSGEGRFGCFFNRPISWRTIQTGLRWNTNDLCHSESEWAHAHNFCPSELMICLFYWHKGWHFQLSDSRGCCLYSSVLNSSEPSFIDMLLISSRFHLVPLYTESKRFCLESALHFILTSKTRR